MRLQYYGCELLCGYNNCSAGLRNSGPHLLDVSISARDPLQTWRTDRGRHFAATRWMNERVCLNVYIDRFVR